MATDATLQPMTATRADASSTAWFWWKESRQLAPLVVLLLIVATLIILLNTVLGSFGRAFISLPHAVTMLVFPGLFATGAGPLLVGQERSQRTLDWLVLLPISAARLFMTKFCVALVGLAVMWGFALAAIAFFDLGSQSGDARWRLGGQTVFTQSSFSYPVWIAHSVFILLCGFFVAWQIKNQFQSLLALLPLAFSPFFVASFIANQMGRAALAGNLDWLIFGCTLLGIGLVAPLTYRAAIKTLGPDRAPSTKSLWGDSLESPAETDSALAPRFHTHSAPIIWQSVRSAPGSLIAVSGMLIVSFVVAVASAATSEVGRPASAMNTLLMLAPIAVCWLGISVFKNDGAAERIRFLADRGISPTTTYLALHAMPMAVLSTSLVVYGVWNLTISHEDGVSPFAAGLPTLAVFVMYVFLIYGISQWVSQSVRTLILSVVLAPLMSIITVGWLTFAFGAMGLPAYGMVICGILPFIATWLMMRRYMDSRDRPATFVIGGLLVACWVLIPLGFAASYVYSVPRLDAKVRGELLSEAIHLKRQYTAPIPLTIVDYDYVAAHRSRFNPDRDRLQELEGSLSTFKVDPERIVEPIRTSADRDEKAAFIDEWEYRRWHGALINTRIRWRQDPSSENWAALASWLDASAVMLPALRRCTQIGTQEVADRLEVLLIDTLKTDVPSEYREDPAVTAVLESLGTPASRAEARRRAVLVTWRFSMEDGEQARFMRFAYLLNRQPQGLVGWMRVDEYAVAAMLEGIESAANHTDDAGWRKKMHRLHQGDGVFETSRYGDAIRSRPAIETMTLDAFRGYGQLWGRAWEYEDYSTLVR